MASPPAQVADRAAFETLFEKHARAVFAYVVRRTSSAADAEDAAAETFAIAWRRHDAIPDDALPWLYGVARRVLANQRRGGDRRLRLIDRLRSLPAAPVGHIGGESTPAIDALDRLRPDDQELLRLVAWEELSHAEIAIVLGISPNAVAIRLHRARARFEVELASGEMKGSMRSRTSNPLKGRMFGRPRREESE